MKNETVPRIVDATDKGLPRLGDGHVGREAVGQALDGCSHSHAVEPAVVHLLGIDALHGI